MIAQAEFCPSMIGGVPLLVRSCVKEIPLETLEPGDVICHNDPYRGGLHCPEHTLIKPVFVDDELMGFAMTIGHLQEIGGMVPGAFAGEATEIFHEGIRVPPVKIKSRGEDVEEVWKLLLANVRTPRYNYGDLRALIAGVDVGERGLANLIRKYGKDQFRQNVQNLMDYSESRMRAEIDAIADGVYRFQDQVEDDGIESRPYDHQGRGPRPGRRGGDRLFRHLAAGAGPDQRHPRRLLLRRLQRHAARHRRDHPQELGLLPPDPRGLAARHHAQRGLSGARGGRQHRDPLQDRGRRHRRAGAGAARPHHGGGRCDPHQLRLRRHRRGERRGLRLLRHRARRLGRAQLRRRQRRHRFDQRQLPRRAGGGVRDPLSLPHRVLHPGAGFGRRGRESRRPQHAADDQEHQDRDHRQPDVGPPPQPPLGAARRPARRPRRHLAPAGQHDQLAHDRRGLRQGQPQQVEQRAHPAGRFQSASRLRAAAAGAIRASARASRWSRTSPKATSPPPPPASTTASRARPKPRSRAEAPTSPRPSPPRRGGEGERAAPPAPPLQHPDADGERGAGQPAFPLLPGRRGTGRGGSYWSRLSAIRASSLSSRAARSGAKSLSIHHSSTARSSRPTSRPSGTPSASTSAPVTGNSGAFHS